MPRELSRATVGLFLVFQSSLCLTNVHLDGARRTAKLTSIVFDDDLLSWAACHIAPQPARQS